MERMTLLGRSIDKVDDCFAGASKMRYTKPWSLTLPDLNGLDETLGFATRKLNSKRVEVLLLRGRCHLLLNSVPDEGLAEVHETLKEIREFYASRHVTESAFPTEQTTTVRITGSYDRPEFPVSED